MALSDEIRLEKIQNLQFIPLCFNQPNKKKLISQNICNPQTMRAMILAYLLKDLEIALINCKTLNDNEFQLNKISLKDQIN